MPLKSPSTFELSSKHIWLIACTLFVGLFLPLLFREWLLLRDEGQYDVEWHSTSLAALLQRDLEERTPLSKVLGDIDRPENYAELDRTINAKIGHLGLLKVKIYNKHGKIIYATDQSQIGKIKTDSERFRQALSGATISEIIPRQEYLHEYGEAVTVDMAEVYVPIRDKLNGGITYVFEAYYDYTPIQERTTRLMLRNSISLAIIILIFIILYIGHHLNKRRLHNKIRALESFLPICQHCKKIRIESPNQQDHWETVEAYFATKNRVKFSHGICDECMNEHYPEVKRFKAAQRATEDE